MSWVCPRRSSDLPLGKGGVGSLIYRGGEVCLGSWCGKSLVYSRGLLSCIGDRNILPCECDGSKSLFLAEDSGQGSFSQETELFIGLGFCTKGCQAASLLKSLRVSPGEGMV